MATDYFVVVGRDGVVIHPRVRWEAILELLALMMVRKHRRKSHCFYTVTDTPEQLAQIRAVIQKRITGSVIAQANRTIKREHYSNEKGTGWYYEFNDRVSSSYAGSERELTRAA